MKKNKVRVQFQRVGKRLETIRKNINAIPEQVLEIVKDGQYIAQNTLVSAVADPNFTQEKVPMTHMADCIVVETAGTKNLAKIRLIAKPTDKATYWNMYFAEYGAGVDRNKNATAYWTAVAKEVALTGKKHKSWNSKADEGYWYFKDYNGEIHKVNTSTKVRYMQAGVRYIKRELDKFKK